jgi:hypothetical protein
MIDSQYIALADGGLNATHRARLARHQGSQALAPHESTTLLGSVPPRKHGHQESII